MNPLQIIAIKVHSWMGALILSLPEILASIVVISTFYLFAIVSRRGLENVFYRSRAPRSVVKLFGTIVQILVLIFGVLVALGVLGLDKTVTSVLAGVGIAGIAAGFALQDLASNLIAGISLIFRNTFKEGDLVVIEGEKGIVQEVNLRFTELQTLDGRRLYIPNRTVFTSIVTNESVLGKRRVDVRAFVDFSTDLSHTEEIVRKAIENLPMATDGPLEIFFEEIDNSSIRFVARFWISFSSEPDFLHAQSQAIKAIKTTLDSAGIVIPYPISTVHLQK